MADRYKDLMDQFAEAGKDPAVTAAVEEVEKFRLDVQTAVLGVSDPLTMKALLLLVEYCERLNDALHRVACAVDGNHAAVNRTLDSFLSTLNNHAEVLRTVADVAGLRAQQEEDVN